MHHLSKREASKDRVCKVQDVLKTRCGISVLIPNTQIMKWAYFCSLDSMSLFKKKQWFVYLQCSSRIRDTGETDPRLVVSAKNNAVGSSGGGISRSNGLSWLIPQGSTGTRVV